MDKLSKIFIFIAVFWWTALPFAFATEMSQARVLEIHGEAVFLKAGTSQWVTLEEGMILKEGDALKTGKDSEVRLEVSGARKTAELIVRKESEFNFKTLRHDPGGQTENTLLDVEVGSVLVKAEKLIGNSKFEVKTPTSIVGIRGTIFEVNVAES
jgi:hypothetical protein